MTVELTDEFPIFLFFFLFLRSSIHPFTFLSFSPKLDSTSPTISSPLAISYGEDALMARSDSLAVADGVGGWDNKEADSALFSRLLLQNISQELQRIEELGEKAEEFQKVEPVEVMSVALGKTENVIGSCTTVLAILRGSQLRVATVGDAGLLVARKGEIVLRTKEQQHSFNFPYQLGKGCKTTPRDASKEILQVQLGDVLVMATDGLFDNLFDHQILEIIEKARKGKSMGEFEPTKVSETLVKAASDTAADTRSRSPFEAKAMEEGLFFQGGKMDDISVVVAVVDNPK